MDHIIKIIIKYLSRASTTLVVTMIPFINIPLMQPVLQEDKELIDSLNRALQQREKYIESFKDLTAEETAITEIFHWNGNIEKSRKQVAYLFIYLSPIDNQTLSENRFVFEVDGKLLPDRRERLNKLVSDLSKAKKSQDELARLKKESLKYSLRYYRWGITLNPAPQLEQVNWNNYKYEIVRGHEFKGRNIIILNYRSNSTQLAEAKGLLRSFRKPRISERGQLFLDAHNYQFYRWENERYVYDEETGKQYLYLRDEIDYASHTIASFTPEKITVTFFNKLKHDPKDGEKGPGTFISGRITYSYGPFKRFEVSSSLTIKPDLKSN